MKDNLSLFERFLYEAPGDDPPADQPDPAPDTPPAEEAPPDIPDDDTPPADAPPDEAPPDMDDGTDDFGQDDQEDQAPAEPDMSGDVDNDNEIGLDDKVSAIMNMNLYQRFLTLLTNIQTQMQLTKNNLDMFYVIAPDSIGIVKSLTSLDENIRIYLKEYFPRENYSKNLLFFNKSLNLLKLLNDSFNQAVHKGIKQSSNN